MAKQLYHLSFKGDLPKKLMPRQPHGSKKGKDGKYAEDLPPRVSFSPSVQQCFSAIYPNIFHVFEKVNEGKGYPYIIMYVYVPVLRGGETTIPESEVRRKVWDWQATGEVCFSSGVEVRVVAKIKIPNPYRNGPKIPEITIQPSDAGEEPVFVSPKIKFSVVEKYGEPVNIL